jgi:hypothetical protein
LLGHVYVLRGIFEFYCGSSSERASGIRTPGAFIHFPFQFGERVVVADEREKRRRRGGRRKREEEDGDSFCLYGSVSHPLFSSPLLSYQPGQLDWPCVVKLEILVLLGFRLHRARRRK